MKKHHVLILLVFLIAFYFAYKKNLLGLQSKLSGIL